MAQVRIELKTKKKTSRINECKCAYGYIIYIYLKKIKTIVDNNSDHDLGEQKNKKDNLM